MDIIKKWWVFANLMSNAQLFALKVEMGIINKLLNEYFSQKSTRRSNQLKNYYFMTFAKVK